ncbi:hypothetical protein ACFYTQ_05345 [Nocardia sp. NPDC004068]|uniref:hypothetical protein n=1 Tax=Nocardia sp. NPDC004068 TaxID=3364303 RepID=UPI00368604E4
MTTMIVDQGVDERVTAIRRLIGKTQQQLARENVDVWSVGLAVEAMDGTEAVKRNEKVHLAADTPREQVGPHYIDMARGFPLHGDREGAFDALQVAKRTAQMQTRYHPDGARDDPAGPRLGDPGFTA